MTTRSSPESRSAFLNPGGLSDWQREKKRSFRVLCGSGYKLAVRRRWRESLSRVDQRGCRRGIFEGMAQVSKAIPAKKRTAAGEVTPPAAGCTLAHPRPGYPSLGCVPAEPNSVSPDGMSLAQYAYRINVHLATCAMPPKILRRQPHLASGLTATHRKPGRTKKERPWHEPGRFRFVDLASCCCGSGAYSAALG